MTALKRSSGIAATGFALMGILGGFLWASLSGCAPVVPLANGGGTADFDFDLSTQSVMRLDFGAKDTVSVKLVNVPAGRLYLGKANISRSVTAATVTGLVSSFAAGRAMAVERNAAALPGGRLMDDERTRGFTPPPGVKPKALVPAARVIQFGDTNPALAVGSSTRQFWVENAAGTWVQLTATLRAASATAYIWIPSGYFSNLSNLGNDNLLNQTQIDTLEAKFSGASPTTSNGIRALVSNIFSTENGGEVGGDGGIDGDQHIHILLYDIGGDYVSNQNHGTMGFFWAKDEYSDASVQPTYRSNEAELFYLDVYFADVDPDMMISTLAHEYQHMINFNQKTLLHTLTSATWFDEMCSMASEDFVAASLDLPDGATPRSRIPQFNNSYYQSGVTDWLAGDTEALKSYASDYVFGAYLSRNYGGAALFRDIVVSSTVDEEAVTAALQKLGTGTSFEAVFRSYSPTFVFGNPAPSGAYSFPALASTLNGITYTLPAFTLGDYSPNLALFLPTQQTALRPYGHSIHSATAWIDPAESTVITVQKPTSSTVQMELMFVKN